MKRIVKLLLLILWLGLIYYLSSQSGSESSGLSGGLLFDIAHFLNIKNVALFVSKFFKIIRKLAHIVEYFVLTVLIYINIIETRFNKNIFITAILSIIFAGLDEIHQLFVEGRAGTLFDVGVDSIGVILAIFFIHLMKIYVAKRKSN